jgi:hypothetical protein
MGVSMIINCLQRISYIDIFNTYDLRLLVMILLVNKNYSSFMFIFKFSQSHTSPQQCVRYHTSYGYSRCHQNASLVTNQCCEI